MGRYLRPTDLDEALDALRAGPTTVLAGGTDFYPARVGRAIDEDVVDLTALAALRGIEARDDHWRIGATTTWTDVIEADLPPLFHGLRQAAREIGGVQIQNAGTIAGNLCNGSPAADGAPVLLALDASVELRSSRGERVLPLTEFMQGNRKTARAPDEIVVAIRVLRRPARTRSRFRKLGARRYLVISIVSVAVRLDLDEGHRISSAGVAVGACAPTALRLPLLEQRLTGQQLAPGLSRLVAQEQLETLVPIDDVRGSAAYRVDAVATLLRRALDDMALAA